MDEENDKLIHDIREGIRRHGPVPFAWFMGYDLYPVETLAVKKKLLPQAARENWTCLFYHEPDQALGRIVEQDGKLRVTNIV